MSFWPFPVIVLLFMQTSLFAQAKIGYIDSQKIRKAYTAVQDAERALGEENRKWEKELSDMDKELKTLIRELDEQSLLLSETRKKEKQDKITEIEKRIMEFQKRKWGDGGEYIKKQEALLKPVYEEIKKAVDEVSEEEGLDIVFDTIQGNIIFAKEQLDITDKVIEILQKDVPVSDKPPGR